MPAEQEQKRVNGLDFYQLVDSNKVKIKSLVRLDAQVALIEM